MPDNKIICQECKAEGNPKSFSRITNWHLVKAHKILYPDVKTALKKYKQKFPKAPIIREGYYDYFKKPNLPKEVLQVDPPQENITDLSEMDQAEWSRNEAHRKYYELEQKINETEDPNEYQKLVNLQQKFWKEASPARSSIERKQESRTITKKEQTEIDKNIAFLRSIEDELDSLTEVDPNVAKFLVTT